MSLAPHQGPAIRRLTDSSVPVFYQAHRGRLECSSGPRCGNARFDGHRWRGGPPSYFAVLYLTRRHPRTKEPRLEARYLLLCFDCALRWTDRHNPDTRGCRELYRQ